MIIPIADWEDVAREFTVEDVAKFLDYVRIPSLKKVFQENEPPVDGEFLIDCFGDDEALEDIGVKRPTWRVKITQKFPEYVKSHSKDV